MRLSSKILTSMLLTTAIGVGIAGAHEINAGSATDTSAKHQGAVMKMHDLKQKIHNLSDEVRAQLKAARKAGDFEKVKSILAANGINMPKLEKKIEKRMEKREHKMEKRMEKKERRDLKDFQNRSDKD